MSSIPLPRLIGLLHEMREREGPLLIDSIYPRLFKEYYQNERKKVHESAKSVFIHLLICGAIKTGKDMIYIP